MEYLSFFDLDPSLHAPDDRELFSCLINVFIRESEEGRCYEQWQVWVEGLAGFQKSFPNDNEMVGFLGGLVMKEYNEALIIDFIKKWIAECNQKASSCNEAKMCLMQFMEYESEEGLLEHFNQNSSQQADHKDERPTNEPLRITNADGLVTIPHYKLDSITLATGKPYPDDFEYCDEEILLHYKKIGDDHEITLRGRVMTVGWLERMLEKEPIVYMPGVSVMRFFDFEVLKRAYAW